MATPSAVQAALDRLASFYNGNVRTESNPGGFDGDGHVRNFIPSLRDTSAVGVFIADAANRFEAAVAAIEAGPVTSVNGMSGAVVLPEVPKVLPPIVTAPAQGSTPSLTGGALLLSVDRLTSLYGEAQKTIRFQIATAASFAANTIAYDTGVLTQTGVSASLANAQATLTGGTTYYLRAIQTDAKDVSSGWSTPVSFTFPRLPVAPIMSAPANGATNVGAQNAAVSFTASPYSHPNGTAQAARRFEVSKDNFATIVTVNGTVGQASATLTSPKDSLTANTAYKVRAVDTDTNGGVSTGAATSFTTVAQYLANPGEASDGGFMGFQNFGDGSLNHLIVASKSTEASKPFESGTPPLRGMYSRLNGPANSALLSGATGTAAGYAQSVSIGGVAGYLGAIDELSAIRAVLRPAVATVAAFQTGGSEVLTNSGHWSSTESTASNAFVIDMTVTTAPTGNTSKTLSYPVRAIKRVAASMPYPIGTYDASWGGYLAAYFTDLSSGSPQLFMLIVADKATEVTRAWGTLTQNDGRPSRTNGLQYDGGNGSNLPAASYCQALVSGGRDDWYLGAIDEMLAIARMNASLPSGQRLTDDGGATNYWTSTEVDASNAKRVGISSGTVFETALGKSNTQAVRPIRRVAITI